MKCAEKKKAIRNNKGDLKQIQTQEGNNNSKTLSMYPHYCPEEKGIVCEGKIEV